MRFQLTHKLATYLLVLAALGTLFSVPAQAEKADRFKPLNVEADQPGKIDLQNQFVVFNGNVVVSKGTMLIRAARIEVRETPGGYHSAVATGSAGKPACAALFRRLATLPALRRRLLGSSLPPARTVI